VTDADLYVRGIETLLASWRAYARGAAGAAVYRRPEVAVAVFANEPERSIYNNAIFERDLTAAERAVAIDAMEALYAAAGVTRFAAWVHESDCAMRDEPEARGYTLDTCTRAMGMSLQDFGLPRPEIDFGPADLADGLRLFGLPPDLLEGADHSAFHVLAARLDGKNVATALAFDHEHDCGIYNVGTIERARRRGLATALTALQLCAALARGCRTATLQSTQMAERMYASVGFRDLGRFLEYAPASYVRSEAETTVRPSGVAKTGLTAPSAIPPPR
jgi:ribosomal protein S18 acetylase RimI-like enzyme